MNLIAGYVLIGAMALTAPLIVAYLIMLARLFSYMRDKHPAEYKEMGEPSLFMNNSISNSMGVVRFLLDRDYRSISDPRVNQLGERSRQIFMTAIGLFGVALLAFVVMSLAF